MSESKSILLDDNHAASRTIADTTKLLTKISATRPPPMPCVASPLPTKYRLTQPLAVHLHSQESRDLIPQHTPSTGELGLRHAFDSRLQAIDHLFFSSLYFPHKNGSFLTGENKGERAVGRRGYKNPTDLNQASGQEGQIGYPRLIKGEAKCYLELWEAIPQNQPCQSGVTMVE